MTAAPGFGIHEGHNVHPHDHRWQASCEERIKAGGPCSGRWFCVTCKGKGGVPPGTWFDGPVCPQPVRSAGLNGAPARVAGGKS
jgi:hypothetical protein